MAEVIAVWRGALARFTCFLLRGRSKEHEGQKTWERDEEVDIVDSKADVAISLENTIIYLHRQPVQQGDRTISASMYMYLCVEAVDQKPIYLL